MLRIAWPVPSQRLNSPTTRTARARGAHTVNAVPCTAPATPQCSR